MSDTPDPTDNAPAPGDKPPASNVMTDGTGLHCGVYRDGQPSVAPSDLSDLSKIVKEDRSFVWFDLIDPGPHDLALLEKEFTLHPLAVEDAVQAHQRPKIEAYDDYWFVIVHGVTSTPAGLTLHEIAIFAGRRFLVTVRHDPAYPLDEIERRWLAHPASFRQDSGFLLYTILDTVVDGYFPVSEALQEQIDEIEVALFQNRPLHNEVLRAIFSMKKEIQQFRRAALPMRDILNPIIRGDLELFLPEELAYYRDVYDHAVRVIDQLDAVRDLVNSALEIHLSVVANRQNEISKQLTLIATIFLPLSFLTGFFGQNFSFLVEHITGSGAFWWLGMGGQAGVLIILLVFFRYRRWF